MCRISQKMAILRPSSNYNSTTSKISLLSDLNSNHAKYLHPSNMAEMSDTSRPSSKYHYCINFKSSMQIPFPNATYIFLAISRPYSEHNSTDLHHHHEACHFENIYQD